MPDLPDLIDRLPGGVFSLGGGGLVGALVVVAVLAQQGTPADRERFNRQIEQSIGAAVAAIGRYLSGRELVGPARSEATWWKAGAPLPDDEATETPVEQLGAPASRPAVSFDKPSRARRITRAVTAPVRVLCGALAGLWRVLAVWHRWPRAARSAVRLAPLPVAWGFWRFPEETQLALIALASAVYLAALTSPAGLGWWRVRPVWTDGQIYGPGVWVAVRQVLRMEDDEPRTRWLSVPESVSAADARIVLRVPAKWMGGPEAVAAIERVIDERVPGEWVPEWKRTGQEHYVQWTPKPAPTPKPKLPEYVPWKSTGDARRVFVGLAIEGDVIADAIIQTQSATPHWGVAGDTGSGKSTVLYIPVVHGRQHGELVDILDTKRNSLQEAEGFSGVRIHKTTRECIAAFAEFLTSMMAAEAATERGADPALRSQLVPRTLVVDELPTLIKLAYTWWRYGVKGKGTPPFLDWLGIILLQGRSSNHRVVVGTQQFANSFFGGTMERAQIGTRIAVGQQDRVSWGVAFGQSTPVLGFDTDIKGRGAYSDKRKDPDGDYLYVREMQPSYITPDVGRLLAQCPPAPAWFDAGEMAPWITAEVLDEVNATAATAEFLPGGKYGPGVLPAVASPAVKGITASSPSSHGTTGPHATPATTTGTTTAGGGTPDPEEERQEEELPETYSLADAHARGFLPWKAATVRTYFKRGETRGIKAPEGITDGQTSYYTEEELAEWLSEWREWQEKNSSGTRKEVPEQAKGEGASHV
ncbi:type IV secretory system conjugative DNA transfer family protein [Streptomyces sp. NBC_00078]|uniref:type IV secretory system conjugative DNA transfer family protein n=1 Tax=Streptomyces sp. NBC_00078 TaxID=2975643 RepID=UPI0022530327|nr:type IV secretory system conjugative DNA transfer family protein [Streptomyces sp. NBC_00078]MCX5426087.1 type IV secretory system conjugative DNA transfer family protein [Streptomyces sp. NBC_00078]